MRRLGGSYSDNVLSSHELVVCCVAREFVSPIFEKRRAVSIESMGRRNIIILM
jgi:CRP-like cAMP-binding protein